MARTKTNKGSGYNRHKLHYASDFKWRVCQEYLNSNETKIAIQRKNGIKGRTNIVVWLRQFGLNDKPKTLTQSEQLSLNMSQPKPEKVQLEETELHRLKKELADANLRTDAYQTMIEIAEQDGVARAIQNRHKKKYVAKQSTPSKKLDPKYV